MVTLVTTLFILGVISIILTLIQLTNPEKFITKPTISAKIVGIFVSLAFVLWEGFLLFGGA